MTPDQLKSLRALAESTANQTGPTVFGSVAWYRGSTIELAQAVPALIEEVERLREALIVSQNNESKARNERDDARRERDHFGYDALAERERTLRAQLSTLEKHIAHNDDEYRTMKEVLRAEHQECERLRVQLEAVQQANEQLAAIAMRNRPLRVQVDDSYFQEHRVGPSPDEHALILKLKKASQP